MNDGLLDTLAEIIDLRDPYVLGHSHSGTEFATKLARRLGLDEKQDEYSIIKNHPAIGTSLLQKSLHLRTLIPIVSQHHEFYNGEGYPNRLAGNQISIEARIVSVPDAVEAMSSDRPYRRARPIDYIIKELQRCAGTQFGPHVADVAIKILKEMESEKLTEQAIEYANLQRQRPAPRLRPSDAL